jgi:hypothetical protein
MRPALILILHSLLCFPGQTNVWYNVGAPTQLKEYVPNKGQRVRVRKALVARVRLDNWPCAEGSDSQWTENLKFEELPVSATERVVLVEAGAGCAQGGQGSNGAMWVIRLHGRKLSFLATPQQQFNGWLYSIQPVTSHGFRDLVVGWHVSAAETGLSYFRFDGTSYQRISTATQITVENSAVKIIPKVED